MLGLDFEINSGSDSTLNFSGSVWSLSEPIKLQAINDNNAGEIESFTLEVTSVELTEAFPGNPVTVDIIDDDSKCGSMFPNFQKLCFFCNTFK